MRGIDRFHIIPGFSISKSEQQPSQSHQSIFLEASVKLVKECITHASDLLILHGLAVEDTLVPPSGTVWWSTQVLQLNLSTVLH